MQETLESYGYTVTAKKGYLLAGSLAADFLIAARRTNSAGVAALLETARTMPETARHRVGFVLFDRCPRAAENQIVFCLDRIGQGDKLVLIPTKAMQRDRKRLSSLYKACGYFGRKSLLVQEKKWNFTARPVYGVKIKTMDKAKGREQPLDETNVNLLRAALTNYICRAAVQ